MNAEAQIHQVEISIEEAKKQINKMNALIRLSRNKDYKEIFLDGFFTQHAIQQVLLKADPGHQSPEQQADILREIDAIGSLRMHLHAVIAQGRQMEGSLPEHEQAKEELLAEDAA